MSLATRCPQCNTLFKVTSGQLQLHDGQVRCGNCKSVFSGIEYLTAPDTEAWQKLDLGPRGENPQTQAGAITPQTADSLFPSKPGKIIRPLLNFKQGSTAIKVACASLLTTALIQATWWNRHFLVEQLPTLAAGISQAGPGMQQAFSRAATRSLQVEGSGLQALDEDNLRVDLTLRNQQVLPARWPHLKIDLLDPQGLVLASKSIAPSEYQVRDSEAASQSRLIAGNATVEVLAYLNISKLNTQLPESAATGFRLELFDLGPGKHP
ncbi:MAG TPA: zinc-ribbon and DUF3426 domain-containing protein [Limnobacter sp.]|nr:zinc-ribbon and DUF3426 domain-containing protein [Limnobacter sp.]